MGKYTTKRKIYIGIYDHIEKIVTKERKISNQEISKKEIEQAAKFILGADVLSPDKIKGEIVKISDTKFYVKLNDSTEKEITIDSFNEKLWTATSKNVAKTIDNMLKKGINSKDFVNITIGD